MDIYYQASLCVVGHADWPYLVVCIVWSTVVRGV
jgi:hypothetical protein